MSSAPHEAGSPRAGRGVAAAWLQGAKADPVVAAGAAPDAPQAALDAARARLAQAPIPLPENRELRVHLRELRLAGRVEPADAEKILRLAGRLSVAEQRAIGETLLLAELSGGVHPEAVPRLAAHLADERLARSSNQRGARLASAMFGTLGVASGGLTAAATTVLAGLSFGMDPLRTTAIGLIALFGVVSTIGCSGHAASRAIDIGDYGVDD